MKELAVKLKIANHKVEELTGALLRKDSYIKDLQTQLDNSKREVK
jgi:hypothetical protein